MHLGGAHKVVLLSREMTELKRVYVEIFDLELHAILTDKPRPPPPWSRIPPVTNQANLRASTKVRGSVYGALSNSIYVGRDVG